MKRIYLILRIVIVIFIVAGCDTTPLHEMNVNPNSVDKMDMNYFLTAAELGAASNGTSGDNRYSDWRANINFCGHAIQQLATTNSYSAGGDKYLLDVEETNAPFDLFWTDVGSRTYEIIKQTGPGGNYEGQNINARHAARILRVFTFHRLTDWYGNIPYFDANKGMELIFSPEYDKQKAIYADMLKELDKACKGFDAEDPDYNGFAYADIIFNGDIDKWKKWGYSLMLRLAMRVSDVDAEMASIYVTKADSGGLMTENDDNVWVPMAVGPGQWTNQNGISRAFQPTDGGQNSFLGKTLVDWLMGPDKSSVADDDPRLMIISGGIVDWTAGSWNVLPGGDDPLNQVGLPNGLDQNMLDALYSHPVNAWETFSRINEKLLQFDEPYQLMNAAESEFLLAEALERGIGTGIIETAEEHYNKGVKLAMQMYVRYDESLTVSDESVNQYLAIHKYGLEKPALEMIGEQLWVSKFMNWWDAWSDWRRTGYPILVPVDYPGNATNGQIPTKLPIPSYEAASNLNYATGATQPDELTGKVWWDGGPE